MWLLVVVGLAWAGMFAWSFRLGRGSRRNRYQADLQQLARLNAARPAPLTQEFRSVSGTAQQARHDL